MSRHDDDPSFGLNQGPRISTRKAFGITGLLSSIAIDAELHFVLENALLLMA
jgi:hypothetical protein